MREAVVLDASALVDALTGTSYAEAVRARLEGRRWHAPAHVDAEVLSALGRLHRAGQLSSDEVASNLGDLAVIPLRRHRLEPLLAGAWRRRDNLRLADALYVELAEQVGTSLVTTDQRLGRSGAVAEVIGPD